MDLMMRRRHKKMLGHRNKNLKVPGTKLLANEASTPRFYYD